MRPSTWHFFPPWLEFHGLLWPDFKDMKCPLECLYMFLLFSEYVQMFSCSKDVQMFICSEDVQMFMHCMNIWMKQGDFLISVLLPSVYVMVIVTCAWYYIFSGQLPCIHIKQLWSWSYIIAIWKRTDLVNVGYNNYVSHSYSLLQKPHSEQLLIGFMQLRFMQ